MQEKIATLHEKYMQRCLQLAQLGNGFVAPNPMVGAVLVYNNVIIGEGYHAKYGEAHAEVNCINAVKREDKHLIEKATLYVSLEPCAHYGKTPPCVDLIIKNKIPTVVIANMDTFEKVNGAGIQKLKNYNIEVITSVLEDEGKQLNKHFFYAQQHKQPYITLKFAQSNDGFIGVQGKEISISNEATKRYTHLLRSQHQSILVGKNTVLTDNPQLNIRYANGKNPIRIVLGKANDYPNDFYIFNEDAETIFLLNNVLKKITIEDICKQLYLQNIHSVLVEGGAKTLQQFIDSNLWNEAHIITSNNAIGKLYATEKLIKAPIITGNLEQQLSLENNLISIYNNSNDIFTA